MWLGFFFFFSSRRRHTRLQGDWSSDVCSSDLLVVLVSVGWLSRTTSWLAWLFSTSSRKTRIQARVPEIRQAWLSSQAVESLQKLLAGLDRAQRGGTEPDSGLAGRWRARSSA